MEKKHLVVSNWHLAMKGRRNDALHRQVLSTGTQYKL